MSLFGRDEWLQRRAGFTDFHLWVTPYERDERFAAGDYPNQSRGGDGLPRWTKANRAVKDRDIVLWYTLGMHHVVRTEDWPVLLASLGASQTHPEGLFLPETYRFPRGTSDRDLLTQAYQVSC